jgi:hypothetical protein
MKTAKRIKRTFVANERWTYTTEDYNKAYDQMIAQFGDFYHLISGDSSEGMGVFVCDAGLYWLADWGPDSDIQTFGPLTARDIDQLSL